MVLMNGSSRARNASSIINRTNTQGGVKKAGLASSVGLPASLSFVYRAKLGCQSLCPFTVSKTKACGTNVGGIRKYRC